MKKIELIFENAQGKTVTFSLDQPVEPIDVDAVHEAMDEIIAQNVFQSNGGDIMKKKSARIVERNVTDIDLGL